MLSIRSYWTGTDKEDRRFTYVSEYLPRKDLLESNAAEVQWRIQAVADIFTAETGIQLTLYASGWRPKAVNDPTKLSGAAQYSHHLDAEAGDIHDTPDGKFAWWCFSHQEVLQKYALWMEHPCATVLLAKQTPWCHLQIKPPKSGLRVYFPSTNSAETWDKYISEGGVGEGIPLALRS